MQLPSSKKQHHPESGKQGRPYEIRVRERIEDSHRRVEHDQHPRRDRAVEVVGHVVLEPVVLVGPRGKGQVVTQRDDVHETHVVGAAQHSVIVR